MRAERWDVITVCTSCGLKMQANLERIEREKGSDFSLWDRTAPCRRLGCSGFVEFQALPRNATVRFSLGAQGKANQSSLARYAQT
jgi:hypothetical protein